MPTNPPVQYTDASGRGQSNAFRVSYPSRMSAYTDDEIAAVIDVLRSTKTLTQGERQLQFESDFRKYVGAEYAFAVSSGSAALRVAAHLCGLGPEDEVILPAYTFCATAIGIGGTGARLIWADIDPLTRTLSPEDVARKITPRTKVIVAVHLLGVPCDMDPILDIAKAHGLCVVEDCAQAPGAKYKGRRVGSMGDYGCFSFNGAKNMTTLGEGGMLTVRREEDAAKVPGFRHNGVRPFPSGRERYWVPAMSNVDEDLEGQWPMKYCLTEAQCALGSVLLKRLDLISETLRAQYRALQERLSPLDFLQFAVIPPERQHVGHAFVVNMRDASAQESRDEFMERMTREYGVQLIVQYYPLYKYPLFQKMGFGHAECPNLEKYWPASFSYPWWCGMPDETLDLLAESTRRSVAVLLTKTAR
jgi:perosamine synthetase